MEKLSQGHQGLIKKLVIMRTSRYIMKAFSKNVFIVLGHVSLI